MTILALKVIKDSSQEKLINSRVVILTVMELSELMNLLISRGVDYVMAQLPSWISKKEISREDATIILMYIMSNKLDELGKKIDDLSKRVDAGFNELGKKIDAGFNDLGRRIDDLSKKVDTGFNDLSRKIDDLRKEVIDRLDLISNQLRVLNSNIAATYELTSKVMTKIMESSLMTAPPRSQ